MNKPDPYPFYAIGSGSLNLGDTPGVFHDSYYAGLIVQFPVNISFIAAKPEL
ncbi:MAG TPA: hypothetical protein VK658_04885 [Chryseolinea sp.]|nr:hypothetical protein [Chryseolinea sp.]